jgi:glutamate-1-semialdehyde 2,1-aminomutase
MPLSVYCGKKEIMEKLSDTIVSSTYGGETLSLAAAKAALQTYRDYDVIGHIWTKAERLVRGMNALLRKRGIPMEYKGLWPCAALTPAAEAPKDLPDRFHRAAYRHGVSFYFVNYVNFSHQDSDIDETLERMEKALSAL